VLARGDAPPEPPHALRAPLRYIADTAAARWAQGHLAIAQPIGSHQKAPPGINRRVPSAFRESDAGQAPKPNIRMNNAGMSGSAPRVGLGPPCGYCAATRRTTACIL
jgi:hypothetical protein